MDFDDLIEDLVEAEQIDNSTDSSDSKEDTVVVPAEETSFDNDDDQQDDEPAEQPKGKSNEVIEEEDDDIPIDGYYNFLKEYGVLDVPEDFKFEGTPESMEEAMEVTKRNMTAKVSQAIWEHLPDDFKPLLEYGLNGGKSLQEYLRAYNTEVDLENIDLSEEVNQKAIIREYYKQTTPKNDEQIERMLTRLESMGGLDEEADDACCVEHMLAIENGIKSVLVHQDKDMRQVPGWHFDFTKNKRYWVEELEGWRWFYQQLMWGDLTDNVGGLPGIGEVKSKRLLKDATTKEEMETIVVREYKREYGGDWPRYITENGQLLYMRRKKGEMWCPMNSW